MSTREAPTPILREHVFDGIQEYDQKLPNWWLFTLYIFVVLFVAFWIAFYHVHALSTDAAKLDPQIAELRQKKTNLMAAMLNDDKLLAMSKDSAVIAEGKGIYTSVCLPCHGPNLGGKTEAPMYIGRSLLTKDLKYVKAPTGISPIAVYKQIYNGTPDPAANLAKGEMIMPPQGLVLGAEKAAKAAAFVVHEWQAKNP
jgi:cytochrome c oxidase cbb3-type subunit III